MNTARRIVLTSTQPGTGVTTATAILGSVFARRRRDVILAVDLAGSADLCTRLGRGSGWRPDLPAAVAGHGIRSAIEFSSYLPRTDAGLWLLPPGAAPDAETLFWLTGMAVVSLIDRPAGPLDPGDPLLDRAHAIVLVVPNDSSAIAGTVDQLRALAGSPAGPQLLPRMMILIDDRSAGAEHNSGDAFAGLVPEIGRLAFDPSLGHGPIVLPALSSRVVITATVSAAAALELSRRVQR